MSNNTPEKIDLIAELGIGEDDKPQVITLSGVDLKLKKSYTGEEVLKYQTAFANGDAEVTEYFDDIVRLMSADTEENTEKFIDAVKELSIAAAFQVTFNMAVHAGLVSKTGGLALGSAKLSG